ncbi:ubiquitin carboxyl terminal hydrolase 5 [Trichuris trichiura]|uniref:Ubiquitin carboxyl-terminal hydrolase n=1 Tax=Trichuris trichiura TaxID=36087 RepID=A0A077Z301_TRITR|nr:ubiquitin carboxyl terminal hydrolase 5 [Trichuris trichiura]
MNPDDIKFVVPSPSQGIFKDECAFCYDSPEDKGGLFICLLCHVGFCQRHLQDHVTVKKHFAFLNYVRERKELVPEEDGPPRQITKLAIGVEGGFMEKRYDVQEHWTVAVYPELTPLHLSESTLGPGLLYCCKKLMEAESAYRVLEVQSLAGTWDGTMLKDTIHTDLYQVPNPPMIPPSGWRCQKPGCDKTDNLWLNLSDGTIFCGRRYFDGTGGNNHSVDHFCNTAYPLAVKLGTISARGGDVFSYDEDDLVNDPLLEKHLMHFGIDVKAMQKTEKSMIELELDYNQKWEYREIQEEGHKLVPLFGPGLTGMVNMGNSCYLNSVMQALALIPSVRTVYVDNARKIFNSCEYLPTEDFNVQMAKLLCGLQSGNYSREDHFGKFLSFRHLYKDCLDGGIRPASFRLLINRGNAEFASNRQQDVEEFMRFLFEKIENNQCGLHRSFSLDVVRSWRFCLEERLSRIDCEDVKYNQRPEVILSLPVPLEGAGNMANGIEAEDKSLAVDDEAEIPHLNEVKGPRRPRVSLFRCLQAFNEPEMLESSNNSCNDKRSIMLKQLSFNTFPDWLWIQVRKFSFAENWRPIKLDVSIKIPEILDLSSFRACGPHSGKLFIESNESTVDPTLVSQLTDMGFPVECVRTALLETANNLESAVQWLLSNNEQNENAAELPATQQSVDNNRKEIFSDGSGVYQLRGFISHIGPSAHSGHYVCHLLKDGRWVMFNDEKVFQSEKPPNEFGYIYLYERLRRD